MTTCDDQFIALCNCTNDRFAPRQLGEQNFDLFSCTHFYERQSLINIPHRKQQKELNWGLRLILPGTHPSIIIERQLIALFGS